jgi:hypothetical protein
MEFLKYHNEPWLVPETEPFNNTFLTAFGMSVRGDSNDRIYVNNLRLDGLGLNHGSTLPVEGRRHNRLHAPFIEVDT